MDGRSRLVGRLAKWAQSVGVTPTWMRGTLRLQSADGTAKAIVTFPTDFWEQFPRASEDRRVDAIEVIVSDVQALYDLQWKQFEAKNIEVHSTLLKEL